MQTNSIAVRSVHRPSSNEVTLSLAALREGMAVKGRGALSNPIARFETARREPDREYLESLFNLPNDDDFAMGQDLHPDDGVTEVKGPPTQVTEETAKSIISRNQSPDIPFELSINPYRGCEHGCFYCYARPNHSYINLSPGLDFETKISVKINAVELLKTELSLPKHVVSPINLGSVTDCYQPLERDYRLTRGILETLSESGHPVTIVTKSSLIERDIDILRSMAQRQLVQVFISVTSLNHRLSRKMEPRASSPLSRLATIRALTDAGIPVGVLVAPIIPFVNEPEIEAIVAAAAKAGALSAHYTVLRMPWELVELCQSWLSSNFPDRAARVFHRVQEMRGGKNYDSKFGERMKGRGIWAELIKGRMHAAIRRQGLQKKRAELRTDLFDRSVNQKAGYLRWGKGGAFQTELFA